MKKLLLLLLVSGAGFKLSSQNVAACAAAQNICTNPNFLFQGITGTGFPGALSVSNPGTNPQTGNGSSATAPANQGCLLTNGPGPQWLILTVSVSGNLGFIFGEPSSANPQVGLYDWAMWPYTPSTCTNLFNNTLPPVSCNWNAASSGGTGMGTVPASGNVGNYQPSLFVTAGQQFLILISNYSGVNTPVSFTSTGTASLTCGFSSAICAGQTTTVSPVGFVPLTNPSYTIYPTGVGSNINNTGTFTVAPTSSTIYTVQGTGTNAQNVTVTQTSTTNITVNPQPIAAPTVTQTTCTNTLNAIDLHLTFSPATPVPGYTVTWSSVPPSVTSNTATTATGAGANPYTTTIVAAGGCSVVSNFTVNPQPAPATFTLIPLSTIFSVTCAQPTVIIDASNSSFSYTWTNGSAAPIYDTEGAFTSATIGTWTITGQNPVSNCVASHTFIVGINTLVPTAAITPSFQNVTCLIPAQTVSASATPTSNVTHLFVSPGGSTITANSYTAVYIPGPPGTYTHYIVNNLNGCKSSRTFTLASSDNFPLLNVSSSHNFTLGCGPTNSICPITLSGSTTPVDGGPISYTLLPPPGTATNYGFSSASTQYTVNIPGSWLAIVKDNNNNCQTKVPFSVVQDIAGPDIDDIVETPILSCYTHTTLLTAVTSNTNVTFAWSFPGPSGSLTVINATIIANTSTNTASALAANYTLSITDNHNGCTSTKLVPIQQNLFPPKPSISGGNNTQSLTCTTPTLLLTNSSTHNTGMATAGYPTNSIVAAFWSGPSPQQPIQLTAQYLASTPGTYTLVAQDLNNGCTSQTTTLIGDNRIYPVVTPNVSTPIDCGINKTGVVSVAVQGSTTNLMFVWTKIGQSAGTFSSQGKASQTVTESGSYKIVITNTLNGCSITSAASIGNGTMTADFVADHTSGYAPLNVNFINNSHSVDANDINSVWSFGNGTQTTTPAASITTSAYYTQAGTYTVILFATKGNCYGNDTITITVDIPARLEVPNVFTPNGDGINDFFFLKAANLTEITTRIYDRWGHKVYELTSTTGNVSWDGNSDTGKEVASGTYFYVIKATGKDGRSFDTKGTVNLYR